MLILSTLDSSDISSKFVNVAIFVQFVGMRIIYHHANSHVYSRSDLLAIKEPNVK
jgi:hypothetical protein